MPGKLKAGYSAKTRAANMRELNASPTKRSRAQKVAIMLKKAREGAAKAGKPEKGPKPPPKKKGGKAKKK